MRIVNYDKLIYERNKKAPLYTDSDLPSVQMMLSSFYHRYSELKRNLSISDINDIVISSCAPYMDKIITEKYQAHIFNETLRKMNKKNIQCFKISKFFKE